MKKTVRILTMNKIAELLQHERENLKYFLFKDTDIIFKNGLPVFLFVAESNGKRYNIGSYPMSQLKSGDSFEYELANSSQEYIPVGIHLKKIGVPNRTRHINELVLDLTI